MLLISNNLVKVKKIDSEKKKTLINKIKIFVNRNKDTIEIPTDDLIEIKRIERVNCLEINFKIKRKQKYIIIEAQSRDNCDRIIAIISSFLNNKRSTV